VEGEGWRCVRGSAAKLAAVLSRCKVVTVPGMWGYRASRQVGSTWRVEGES